MTEAVIAKINAASFSACLLSIVVCMAVGLLGIWGKIETADGTLWRSLGTCGAIFGGTVLASLAIRCFKTNE